MAEKNPLKYESEEHKPFAPGDTIPPEMLNLLALLDPGPGISITPNIDGTITISSTCAGE